jgi:hypothetical protein
MDGDLLVLVSDRNTEAVVEGVLSRPHSLRIRPIVSRILVHPEKDPGCRLHGHELLRIHQEAYRHAVMVFDREGSGADEKPREELESECEQRLAGAGWKDRGGVIVLDPELEIWIWSDSPVVDEALNWKNRTPKVREWLELQGFTFNSSKPNRPKESVEAALRAVRKPRSSSLYREIAEKVSFDRCTDPAFLRFRKLLKNWFGQ